MKSLDGLRADLDRVDEQLVALLAERARLVDEVWALKSQHALAQVDPTREATMRARLGAKAKALGLSEVAVLAVFERVIGQRLR
jgi:chorismate mutase